MTNKQATQKIYTLMCEIRDTIMQFDQGETPYLSLTIYDDGVIAFNNSYWDRPEDKRIAFHEEVGEY